MVADDIAIFSQKPEVATLPFCHGDKAVGAYVGGVALVEDGEEDSVESSDAAQHLNQI